MTARKRKRQATKSWRTHFKPARALRLEPGDTLVFECNKFPTKEQAEYLRTYLKAHIPEGVHVLVLSPGIQLASVHTRPL
jgi:hypothetical protein